MYFFYIFFSNNIYILTIKPSKNIPCVLQGSKEESNFKYEERKKFEASFTYPVKEKPEKRSYHPGIVRNCFGEGGLQECDFSAKLWIEIVPIKAPKMFTVEVMARAHISRRVFI